jgi:hypothetical protein
VHQRGAASVIAFGRGQRPDDGQVSHLFRDPRHVRADLHALGAGVDRREFTTGRPARLEVPDVNGGGPAAHPHNDEAFVVSPHLLGIGLDRLQEL